MSPKRSRNKEKKEKLSHAPTESKLHLWCIRWSTEEAKRKEGTEGILVHSRREASRSCKKLELTNFFRRFGGKKIAGTLEKLRSGAERFSSF